MRLKTAIDYIALEQYVEKACSGYLHEDFEPKKANPLELKLAEFIWNFFTSCQPYSIQDNATNYGLDIEGYELQANGKFLEEAFYAIVHHPNDCVTRYAA